MALLVALCIAVLTGTGVWLLLRPRSFDVVLGLTLLAYAVNVFILGMGRLTVGRAPMAEAAEAVASAQASAALEVADPLPQALVLTAIVIGFAMTALLLVLALRSHAAEGDDRLEPEAAAQPGASGAQGAPTTPGAATPSATPTPADAVPETRA